MQFNLNNKIVVITGASKGIGAGISKELAIAGATVVLCARNTQQLNELKNEIAQDNGIAHVFQSDP